MLNRGLSDGGADRRVWTRECTRRWEDGRRVLSNFIDYTGSCVPRRREPRKNGPLRESRSARGGAHKVGPRVPVRWHATAGEKSGGRTRAKRDTASAARTRVQSSETRLSIRDRRETEKSNPLGGRVFARAYYLFSHVFAYTLRGVFPCRDFL